jgi:hypothetical protein
MKKNQPCLSNQVNTHTHPVPSNDTDNGTRAPKRPRRPTPTRSQNPQRRKKAAAAPPLRTSNHPHQPIHVHPPTKPPQWARNPPPEGAATMATEPALSSLAELGVLAGHTTMTKEQQRRHYVRALHRVIDEPDVALLVLDVRQPAGCRSRLVEYEVRR